MIETIDCSSHEYEPISQMLTLACKTELNILKWGSHQASKPSCLLLHGLDNNAHVWDELSNRLSKYFNVYAIDFRGHGDSSWSEPSTYNTDSLVNDIEQVRIDLNLDSIYLVGHSLGGRVCTHYAVRYPNRVIAIVIGDIGPTFSGSTLEKMREDSSSSPLSFSSRESYHDYLKEIYILAEENALAQFAKHSLKYDGGRYYNKTDPKCRHAILNPLLAEYNGGNLVPLKTVWDVLPAIRQPVLLIRGEISAVLDERAAERMIKRLANARLATIEMAGHSLMLDNPSQTVKEIENFLLDVKR